HDGLRRLDEPLHGLAQAVEDRRHGALDRVEGARDRALGPLPPALGLVLLLLLLRGRLLLGFLLLLGCLLLGLGQLRARLAVRRPTCARTRRAPGAVARPSPAPWR